MDIGHIDTAEAAFSQFPRRRGGVKVMGRAMRADRWRYVEWAERNTGEIIARELYDHQGDAGETINVADRPELSGVVKELSEKLGANWRGALPAF